MRIRVLVFIVVTLAAAGLAVGYAVWRDGTNADDVLVGERLVEIDDPARLESIRSQPHVLFVNTQPGPGAGRVAMVPLDDLDGPRYLTPLSCARVDFAGGTGLCLRVANGSVNPYEAFTFDERFSPGTRIPLAGYPSRARVSRDGALAALTVFVQGHSYAAGNLSTSTTLVDVASQRTIADLEEFTAYREGQPFKAIDFNYWGVTFADDAAAFYATLATGGRISLVRGDVITREVHVLREGIECPSLSPDGRRIAYKHREAGTVSPTWRLYVVPVASGDAMPLGDARNVDDQANWLDNDHVLYALRHPDSRMASRGVTDVWVAAVGGGTPPRRFLASAYSPAIVRVAF
jgi:hypothetical protein